VGNNKSKGKKVALHLSAAKQKGHLGVKRGQKNTEANKKGVSA